MCNVVLVCYDVIVYGINFCHVMSCQVMFCNILSYLTRILLIT